MVKDDLIRTMTTMIDRVDEGVSAGIKWSVTGISSDQRDRIRSGHWDQNKGGRDVFQTSTSPTHES